MKRGKPASQLSFTQGYAYMVAVFTGNGLGLFNSSISQLGKAFGGSGQIGQGRHSQYVNVATGNLLMQGQDEVLYARGLLVEQVRTYNSLGLPSETGVDCWIFGFDATVKKLSGGGINQAGSTVERTLGDGSRVVYTYDVQAQAYVSPIGDGAHDRIVYQDLGDNEARWTWTEGSSLRQEVYDTKPTGRLLAIRDLKTGAENNLEYDSSERLSRVVTQNGDALVFGYVGNSAQVTALTTLENGVEYSQVRYGYDQSGRLITVEIDLTPGSWTDNDLDTALSFVTTYEYDADSTRMSRRKTRGVTQSDGNEVSYTYYADGRIHTVTTGSTEDGSAATLTYVYDLANRSTDVIDEGGRTWTYQYDTAGQLTQVLSPAVDGQRQITSYTYDAEGNVTRITDALNQATVFEYDASGDLLLQRDAAGNTVRRTYGASHQVLTETAYTVADPDGVGSGQPTGALVTRYVYDERDRVAFRIDPQGAVCQYQYDSLTGLVSSKLEYFQHRYPVAGLAEAQVPTRPEMQSWLDANGIGAMAPAGVTTPMALGRTDFSYDARGLLTRTVAYANVDANGAGVLDEGAGVTAHVYDAQGQLRQQITYRGGDRTVAETASYTYDGLGRLLNSTDATGANTTWVYQDGLQRIQTHFANGLLRTEAYDKAGRTLSVTESAASTTATRSTYHYYDGDARLRAKQDANGARHYFFYDDKGRVEAEVDVTGAVVEYSYDALDRVVQTTRYATLANTTTWLSNGTVVPQRIAEVRPATTAEDRVIRNTYDAAGRLSTEIDAIGTTTTYTYDGAGRLIKQRTADAANTAATARQERYFYDDAGHRIGKLDAEGYLTEWKYDAAGRSTRERSYRHSVYLQGKTANIIESGSFNELLPGNPWDDIAYSEISNYFYDGQGRLVAEVKPNGWATEYVYDNSNNRISELAYSISFGQLPLTGLNNLSDLKAYQDARLPGTNWRNEKSETRRSFDPNGRLLLERNAEGTVTRYTYDVVGNLIRTEAAADTTEVRENNRRYDVFGNLTGELGGEGSARLLPGMTESQKDAIYAQWGTRHSYDALNRRVESIDAHGNKTWYFYDASGRLTHTVKGIEVNGAKNVQGEVQQAAYNAFGDQVDSIGYVNRIDTAQLATLAQAIQQILDPQRDVHTQRTYDSRGLLAARIDGEGLTSRWSYNAFGEASREERAISSNASWTVDHVYDRRGDLIRSVHDAAGINRILAFAYDNLRRISSSTDGNGNAQYFGYMAGESDPYQVTRGTNLSIDVFRRDYLGRPWLVRNGRTGEFKQYEYRSGVLGAIDTFSTDDAPLKSYEAYSYNKHVETVKSSFYGANPETRLSAYDLDGRLTETTAGDGGVERRSYNELGQLIQIVDGAGRTVAYEYDAAGRLGRQIVDPQGLALVTAYAYDGLGRKISETDANGVVTQYRYDRNSRVKEIVHDAGGLSLRTTYTYDGQGRQLSVTEGAGTADQRVTGYVYDKMGRRVAETVTANGLSLTTQFEYDKESNLTRRIDAEGHATRYVYDAANRLAYVIDALGVVTKHAYVPQKDLVASVRTYARAIDLAGLSNAPTVAQVEARLAAVDDAVDGVEYRIYGSDGKLSFTVDAQGAVTEYRYVAGARRDGEQLAYLSKLTLSADDVSKLRAGIFTEAMMTARVADQQASARASYTVYDGAGRARFQVTRGEVGGQNVGMVVEYRYDKAGRLVGELRHTKTIAYTPLVGSNNQTEAQVVAALTAAGAVEGTYQNLRYVYDGAGRLRYAIDALGGVKETRYDPVGRITEQLAYPQAVIVSAALADKLRLGTVTVAEVAALVVPQAALASGTATRFDGVGRTVFTLTKMTIDGDTDAAAVKEYRYDATGLVVAEIAYAVALPDYAAAVSASDLGALLQAAGATASTENRITRFAYDDAGRLRFTIDGTGAIVEQRYDATGKLVATLEYEGFYPTAPSDEDGLRILVAAIPAMDVRSTAYVRDALGQVRFTVDALGNTQETTYDVFNRIASIRRYATPANIDAALEQKLLWGDATPADAAAAIPANDAKDIREYRVYDNAGNMRYAIDAYGAVREFYYDAAGLNTGTRSYSTAIVVDAALLGKLKAGSATTGDVATKIAVNDDFDQRDYKVFDAAGRLRFVVDAKGYVRETRYDAIGQVIHQIDYNNIVNYNGQFTTTAWNANLAELKKGTLSSQTVASWVAPQESTARLRTNVWGADGQLRYLLSGDIGGVYTIHELRHDGNGRNTADIEYSVFVARTTTLTTEGIAAAIATAGGNNAANQRQMQYVHDAAGRQRFAIDDLGGVSEQRYNAFGEVDRLLSYGQYIPTGTAATEAAVSSVVAGLSGSDVRSTRTNYDRAGRVLSMIDAAGHAETYAYDGTGNRVSMTDKLGQVWSYIFDAAGRLVQERSPQVAVGTADATGALNATLRSLVTTIGYDALGNVIERTEDSEGPQPRTTSYEYDNRGHQVKTIFPDAGSVDMATGAVVASGVRPAVEITYNALGQAVVQKDVSGNYSYRIYNSLAQLAYEIDQHGFVTSYGYNAYGEQTSQTRHANKAIFSRLTNWAPGNPIYVAEFNGYVIQRDNVNDRSVYSGYTWYGRKSSVSTSQFDYVTSLGEVKRAGENTAFVYNRYGELSYTQKWIDNSASTFEITQYFYNDLGLLTQEVDSEGGVTSYKYDALGQVVSKTEHGRRLNLVGNGIYPYTPALPSAGDASTGYDRTVRYTYDALGRKTSETQLRYYQDASGAIQSRDVVTRIGYDAEGRAVSTDTDGVVTQTAYDALGRVVSVREDDRDVLRADAATQIGQGVNLGDAGLYQRSSPYSTMVYDAFGNVVQMRRYANGWIDGQAAPIASAADTMHTTRYDFQGRAVWEKDEAGTVYYKTYDAADHLLETRYRLDGNQGRSAEVVSRATYDMVGQQLTSSVSRELYVDGQRLLKDGQPVIEVDATSQVRYNGFGEIVAKDSRLDASLATSHFAAQYVYDQAGRLVRSNAEGGVWRDYGYNLAGRLVREAHPVLATAADGTSDLVNAVTTHVVDRLGRVTRTTQPATGDSGAQPVTQYKYDRWGNVIEAIDAKGGVTTFEYNQSNQVVREIRPQVTVVHADGSETLERPVLTYLYDARGQLIATRDANGNVRRTTYDEVGRVLRSTDGTGQSTDYAYDAMGQQRLTQDPLNYLTFRDFDAAGRIVEQGDYLEATAGGRERHVRESYGLNQNGDRLTVTNELGQTARYDYDSRGLVTRSQTATGVVMSYAYDANGNKIRETNALATGTPAGGGAQGNGPVPNGDFEEGEIGWVLSPQPGASAQVVASGGYVGANALRMSGTGEPADAAAYMDSTAPVTAGQSVTVSAMVSLPSGTYGTSYSLQLVWYDASGAEIGRAGQSEQQRGVIGSGWRRSSFTAVAPAGAVAAKAGIVFNASASSTTSVLMADDFQWNLALVSSSGGSTWITDDEGEVVLKDEQTWDYDFFNRVIDHNDLSGIDYDYSYDPTTGQLIRQHVGDEQIQVPSMPQMPTNLDFELGDTEWDKGNGWSINQADAAGGAWSARYDSLGNSSLVNQTHVPVVAGQSFSLNASIQPRGGSAELLLLWFDANNQMIRLDKSGLIQGGSSWQFVAKTASAPVGAEYLRVGVSAQNDPGEGPLLIDQFHLTDNSSGQSGAPVAGSATSGTREYAYYADGRIREIRQQRSGDNYDWTRYTYDAAGNRLTEETYTADEEGQAAHLKVTSTYDAQNRLSSVVQEDLALGRRMLEVSYGYDAAGNRRVVEATNGFSTNANAPFNGSFEDGDSGWELGNGFSIATGAEVSRGTKDGQWLAVHRGTGAAEIINENHVPVVPGQSIEARGYFHQGAADAGDNWGEVRIIWYDANGARIGETRGNRITSSDGGYRLSTARGNAPANAAYAAVAGYSYKTRNKDTYFDAFSWNYEPATVSVGETPAELQNLSFEQGLINWTPSGNNPDRWVSSDSAYEGQHDVRFSGIDREADGGTLQGAVFAVTEGQLIEGTVHVRYVPVPLTGGDSDTSASLSIQWLDAAGNVLSVTAGNSVSGTFTEVWLSSFASGRVPAGATQARVVLNASGAKLGALDFDAVSVVRRTASNDRPQSLNQKTYWYAYDGENRVTVANGRLVNGLIEVGADDTSFALSYDNAGHAVHRISRENGTLVDELTQYDLRGQRIRVFDAVPLGQSSTRQAEGYEYDLAGRQTAHRTYDENGNLQHLDRTVYDADGRTTLQTSFGRSLDGTGYQAWEGGEAGLALLSRVDYQAGGGYDAAGRLQGYAYTVLRNETGTGATSSTPQNYTHTYAYAYEGRESYLEKTVSGTSSNSNFKASYSASAYDAWGQRTSVREYTPNQDVDDRLRYLAYDQEGNILRRREGKLENGVFTQNSAEKAQTQLYAYVSGQQVGSGKYNGELDVIGRLTAYDSSEVGSVKITVQAGDTLRSIAQRVYGNGNLWYVLAEANAISDEELVQGTQLTVPDVKVTANDATTFKPFNPNEAIGNTAPSLPYITPPPRHHCKTLVNVLSTVVGYVVGAIVGAYTNEYIGAAVRGAVKEHSRQVFQAMADGRYDWPQMFRNFTHTFNGDKYDIFDPLGGPVEGGVDYKAVAVSSATSLATYAVAGYGSDSGWGDYTNVAAQALTSYAANYQFSKWAGYDVSWSNRQLGTNVGAALISQGIFGNSQANPVAGAPSSTVSQSPSQGFSWSLVAQNVARSAIQYSVGKALDAPDAHWNTGNVLADAFGNALGNAAVGKIQNWQANRAGIGPVERERIGMEPMPLDVDDIAFNIAPPSLTFDGVEIGGSSGQSATSTRAAPHARVVPVPTRADFSDVTVTVDSTAGSENVPTLDTVRVVGTRPRDLTMNDLTSVLRLIASGPRQSVAKGVRLFDRDALNYAEGSYGGRVRVGAEFDAREVLRAQLQQADANSRGKAQLVMLAPEGMSDYDKLVNSIRASGGYISEEVGQNLLDQVNTGADAIDLTYARAQSESVMAAIESTSEFRSQVYASESNGMLLGKLGSVSSATIAEVENQYLVSDPLLPAKLSIGELGVQREVGRAFMLASTIGGIPDLAMLPLALARGIGGKTTLRTFSNLFPKDRIDVARIVPNDQLRFVSNTFNYTVLEDGSLVVGRSAHTSLTGGASVQAAGEVKIVHGQIKWIDNASGHYQPSAKTGSIAERAFENIGLKANGTFVPKIWVPNPKLPRGGSWQPVK